MKRSLKWPVRLGITLLIIYIGICFGMKWMQQRFLFHPEVVGESHKWDLGPGAEEQWFTAEDGARVNGILHKVDSAVGVVLYLHGNSGNVGTAQSNYGRFLAQHHDVLYIDYRTFGKSTGKMYEQGLHYDAEAAYEYLKSKYKEPNITVYGQSLGSGIATHLAAKYNPRQLILEASYTSMQELAQGRYPWLPISWLLEFPLQSKEEIQKVKCPVLLFHGTADETVPYTMGVEMAKATNKGKLVTLTGAGHNQCNIQALYQEELAMALAR